MKEIPKLLCVTAIFVINYHLNAASEKLSLVIPKDPIKSDQKLMDRANKLHGAVQNLQLDFIYPMLNATQGTSFEYTDRYQALSDLSKILSDNVLPLRDISELPNQKKLSSIATTIQAGIEKYHDSSQKHYTGMAIPIEEPVIVVPSQMEVVEGLCAKILTKKRRPSLEK